MPEAVEQRDTEIPANDPSAGNRTSGAQTATDQMTVAQMTVAQMTVAQMTGAPNPDETLRAEVADLADVIFRARAEIAALEANGGKGRNIPAATDELDAIVEHTAAATDAILEACETLDETARKLEPPGAGAVQASTARIYEACSFQDIVGQRISKVVATLRMIDAKVAHLKGMLGERPGQGSESQLTHGRDSQSYEQQVLLNGPQLVATAMAQSEVDRLLAGPV